MRRTGHVICTCYIFFVCVIHLSNSDLNSFTDLLGSDDFYGSERTIEVLAKRGETVVLPCEPSSGRKQFFSNGSIHWFKNGVAVKISSDDRLNWNTGQGGGGGEFADQGQYSVRIVEVDNRDDGVWQCRQIMGQRHSKHNVIASQPIRLIIASVPRGPKIMVGKKEYAESSVISVTEDSDFQISCVVQNGRPPSRGIDWMLEDVNVTSSSSLYVQKEEFTSDGDDGVTYVTTSVLDIRVVRQHNQKALHCLAYHPLWTSNNPSIYVVLNVIYKPSFVLSRYPGFGVPIIEGSKVSLHCKINSNPSSMPYWVKDVTPGEKSAGKKSMKMDDGDRNGYLNFSSISRQDAGWYRCSTDHQLGHFASFGYFLSVKHAPEIVSSPPKKMEAELGDDVLLECGATGSPAPSYCWSRIKGRHRHGYPKKHRNHTKKGTTPMPAYQLESMGLEQNLLLDRLLYSDSGTYKCTASNRIGTSHRHAHSHAIHLTVKGRPTVEPINRTVRLMTGRPASLSVQICANPPPDRLHWIIGDMAITPKTKVPGYHALKPVENERTDCYVASLEIDAISPKDSGQVIVIAKNVKGVNEGIISVNLTTATYMRSLGTSIQNFRGVSYWLILVILSTIKVV